MAVGYTSREIAQKLGLSERRIFQMVQDGELIKVRRGRYLQPSEWKRLQARESEEGPLCSACGNRHKPPEKTCKQHFETESNLEPEVRALYLLGAIAEDRQRLNRESDLFELGLVSDDDCRVIGDCVQNLLNRYSAEPVTMTEEVRLDLGRMLVLKISDSRTERQDHRFAVYETTATFLRSLR